MGARTPCRWSVSHPVGSMALRLFRRCAVEIDRTEDMIRSMLGEALTPDAPDAHLERLPHLREDGLGYAQREAKGCEFASGGDSVGCLALPPAIQPFQDLLCGRSLSRRLGLVGRPRDLPTCVPNRRDRHVLRRMGEAAARKRQRLAAQLQSVCPHTHDIRPASDASDNSTLEVRSGFETFFGTTQYRCMYCGTWWSDHVKGQWDLPSGGQ